MKYHNNANEDCGVGEKFGNEIVKLKTDCYLVKEKYESTPT